MTREEAIKTLKEDGCSDCTWGCESPLTCDNEVCPLPDAIEMAIQALSQEPICDRDCEHCTWTECPIEPCTDAVSREEVKKIVDFYTEQYDGIFHVNESIDKLPSVTQKSGWNPVSERLPEEEIDVLVCNSNGEIEISAGSYSTEANDFMWYTSGWRFGKVIAWMPLPKPYEPQESEE